MKVSPEVRAARIAEDQADDSPRLCASGQHDTHAGERKYDNRGYIICADCKRESNKLAMRAKRQAERDAWIAEGNPLTRAQQVQLGSTPEDWVAPGFSGTFSQWLRAASEWMEWPYCTASGGDFHFPVDGESRDERALRIKVAKGICADCPVLYECREYALEANEQVGIWGGLTVRQRRRIRNNEGEVAA